MERFQPNAMVTEYIGELIRSSVAEKREKAYEEKGIPSCYLFRITKDYVVDATLKGNLARFMNHSCEANCYADVVDVNGEPRILIYSKQVIEPGDEITYDYKFPYEEEKIPCYCGTPSCKGFLN
eukprot:TRINITY_DN22084_c0_g1_i1.p1 TRINITY_DN22084_c0_g1~~TRINITY_DN22084_c0_g1_i1.p1  ORF type:complete len:124 (-),score=28.59 TRINITY_DN22084_c0_g1_i1:109-480(-)